MKLGVKRDHLCFFLCLTLIVLFPIGLYASPVNGKDPKEQYQKIQKEIESHKQKLERIKKKEHSTLDDIDRINRRLVSLLSELQRQKRKIEEINEVIKRIEAERLALEGEIERERTWLKRRLKALQRYGRGLDFMILLTSDDVGEIMRRWRYLERISLYERKAIEDYSKNLEQRKQKERELKDLNERLKRGLERIRINEATLREVKKEKESLLASIRREKASHERMIKELKEASKRLLELLREIERKEREKEEIYAGRGFRGLKGRLPWPVNGKVVIPYGSQVDPRFKTPVFRNGVYIETSDAFVKSVSGGKVVYSDWFKGYGNLVIINHGEGYHTLYGNLSETFLKAGDIIKEGDVIGKVGASGMLKGPCLYFEVRYKGKPLNPLQWLKRLKK